jgi:hypothetical protein
MQQFNRKPKKSKTPNYLNDYNCIKGTGHNLSGGWGGVIQNFKE